MSQESLSHEGIERVRLTQTVKKGGCAAKLPAGQLRKVLSALNLQAPRQLWVGTDTLDDACLWDLGENSDELLVQTLDFFTPIVDDPEDFGAIAAANAISDVYAMGGEPKIALSILAFPGAHLPFELLSPLMKGAVEKIRESGSCLAGGHTIDDETLKLGFSVTGFVKKGHEWKNSGAQPGDVLILTKGLGTGTLTTALKANEVSGAEFESQLREAIASMKQLNRVRDLLGGISVHAATDITGFGLAGHAYQMAQASGSLLEFDLRALPALPGAVELLAQEFLNKAHYTNRDYVSSVVAYPREADALRWLTVDPQTSGGLLLSVPSDQAEHALAALRSRFPRASRVGRVLPKEGAVSHYARFVEG
jgi:selenide,water dikinase